MASIVTKMLSSIVGLLVNKARDSAADKLKDGDVTDAKIREFVVRELNDVKKKLDGLSRAPLLSSLGFLKQGINLLKVSLINKSMDEQKDVDKPTNEQATSTMSSSVQSEILNEALPLSQAMEKLNIVSQGHFECAKERFKDARTRAFDAFFNQALSIEDRLMAAKLHIVATVLECLESPEHAITSCLSFLEELHGLEAIAEIFSMYLNRGFMSRLNKAQRVECVKSVMLVNYTLFQFVFKFSSKYTSTSAWPTIELAERSFNPILHWQEVSTRKSMGDELTQLPNKSILDEDIIPRYSAVNSHGDVVVGKHPDTIKIIPKTGESKVVKLPEPSEGEVIRQHIVALAVDKNNNVYVVRRLETSAKYFNVKSFVLDVLDENYHVNQDSRTLEYLDATKYFYSAVQIAINKNNNIVVMRYDDPQVYICDNTGKLKHKFEQGVRYPHRLGICGQDEIMIATDNYQAVEIYSEEGNPKSTIKSPEGHAVRGLAFHYVICKIIVLTYVEKKDSYFLLCYTEAGELETTTFFSERIDIKDWPRIKSHPSGPVAIVRQKSITFI
ncbi:Hypothetical predicted protein [Paramuricea clavata]|uniref:Uncharacterized protein n=1 Tax=Paramuricea clavata TaxID=317549 RepID=A0A6S7LJ02_PARCT|nr:Hypothetical predicted protein [Paramuricea clavata]